MKIERLDEKTVRCQLSNEELKAYNIDYKDFVLRSDKAKEVVSEIMEQAKREVGYIPPQFAFDLQIMMTASEGLTLTFSEKELPELTKEEDGSKKKQQRHPEQVMFFFENLANFMDYTEVLPKKLRIKSELYKGKKGYFLYLGKGRASYPCFSKICIQTMEFGYAYSAKIEQIQAIREQADCLIAGAAITRFRRN